MTLSGNNCLQNWIVLFALSLTKTDYMFFFFLSVKNGWCDLFVRGLEKIIIPLELHLTLFTLSEMRSMSNMFWTLGPALFQNSSHEERLRTFLIVAAMKLKDICSRQESNDKPRRYVEKQRHNSADKGLYSQSYVLPNGHVWLWELDCNEGGVPKNWCLRTVVLEKTPESPLDSKEIKPVNLKGNQPWILLEGLMLKLKL